MFSNPLGLAGHDPCVSEAGMEPMLGGEARVGQCYNELECVAMGGLAAGYCADGPGSNILVSLRCDHEGTGVRGAASLSLINNWPQNNIDHCSNLAKNMRYLGFFLNVVIFYLVKILKYSRPISQPRLRLKP